MLTIVQDSVITFLIVCVVITNNSVTANTLKKMYLRSFHVMSPRQKDFSLNITHRHSQIVSLYDTHQRCI